MTEATDIQLELSPEEAAAKVADGAQLIDVRQDYEWEAGRIDGASHIPLEQLPAQAEQIDRDRPIVFQCRSGSRSALATQVFREAGYEAFNLSGGLQAWVESDREIVPADGDHRRPPPGRELSGAGVEGRPPADQPPGAPPPQPPPPPPPGAQPPVAPGAAGQSPAPAAPAQPPAQPPPAQPQQTQVQRPPAQATGHTAPGQRPATGPQPATVPGRRPSSRVCGRGWRSSIASSACAPM